jgi:hypothetical protein
MWSGIVALSSVSLLVLMAAARDPGFLRWSLAGWALAALPGVTCGTALVRVHGEAGTAFLKILGASMAVRLIAFPLGAWVALASSGRAAVVAYAIGLVAGYAPTQVFEAAWFLRRSRGALSWGVAGDRKRT